MSNVMSKKELKKFYNKYKLWWVLHSYGGGCAWCHFRYPKICPKNVLFLNTKETRIFIYTWKVSKIRGTCIEWIRYV